VTADDVRLLLLQRVNEFGTCSGFARQYKVHRTAIQHFLVGNVVNPPPQILEALGLTKKVDYVPK
jgi:hypothetical protein